MCNFDHETGEDVVPDIFNNEDKYVKSDGTWVWVSEFTKHYSGSPESYGFERVTFMDDRWQT
ncbi:hypothetical protein [Shewanella algae]|uniref:hypothetical protein n=1 Tax=Shewanella algae TaxID=38313 RepID=UPI001AAEFE63|nr:hypothetical protein [Shewanella algae]MBO2590988.1 hypothetical protein [Shewanella algae]MBO2590997.1 hypothetical protein [Shewanella algae]